MSKIKLVCDIPPLEGNDLIDYLDEVSEKKDVDLDWSLIQFFKVSRVYKYKNYFLYQVDNYTVILGKPNHDYYHTDIQKIAQYFKLGEKYKIHAGIYNYEETYLMLYTMECEDK